MVRWLCPDGTTMDYTRGKPFGKGHLRRVVIMRGEGFLVVFRLVIGHDGADKGRSGGEGVSRRRVLKT